MKPFKNDVAVLLLFFTRPEQTKKVFAAIKEARPSILFLYQDGPRDEKKDMEGILECREIVEDIDWECKVYKNYLEKNQGCDPSGYLSRKWMFSIVDRGIILEDDTVPCQSFFPFCKELLDKYANDQRINMICGMNNLETYDCGGSDYFFSQSGSIWGWATWKRVVDEWDPYYLFLNNDYILRVLRSNYERDYIEQLLERCKIHLRSGREHFETIGGMNCFLQGRYNIVPSVNMISNVGISEDSTHSTNNLLYLPRAVRRLFYMQTHEMNFPIKHPDYIICDNIYMEKLEKNLRGSWLVRMLKLRRIEAFFNRHFLFFSKL